MEHSDIAARLAEIKKREAKATAGPWCWDNRGQKCDDIQIGTAIDANGNQLNGNIDHLDEFADVEYSELVAGELTSPVDADFIAHSRQDIPWLIKQLEDALRDYEDTLVDRNSLMGDHIAVTAENARLKCELAESRQRFSELDAAHRDLEKTSCDERLYDYTCEENERLRTALNRLANEATGFLQMADRGTHGNTNMRVLEKRIQEGRDALVSGHTPTAAPKNTSISNL